MQKLAAVTYTGIGLPVLVIAILIIGVWPIIGAIVITRHPENPVGWLLILGIMVAAVDMFAAGYATYDIYVYAESLPAVNVFLVWLNLGGAFPIVTVVFALMMLLFPDGRFPSPGWQVVGWTAVAAVLAYLAAGSLRPSPVDPFSEIFVDNPLGVTSFLWGYRNYVWWVAFAILVLCYSAALISLTVRLRQAQGDER